MGDVTYNGETVSYGGETVTYGGGGTESARVFLDAIGLSGTTWLGPAVLVPPRSGGGYLLGDYRYRIYIRARDLSRVCVVDDFDSLSYAIRLNAVGGWTLSLPIESAAADALRQDGAGIQVVRDGEPLISGPVRERKRSWDIEQNPAGTLEASGPDDLALIADRLALPQPEGPPFSTDPFDVRTGPAGSVILAYVDANAGPGAPRSERRQIGLTLGLDDGVGLSVFGRARFDNLLDLCAALALVDGNLGFRCVQVGASLVFSIYVPRDLTDSIEFSDRRENVTSIEHTTTGPEANFDYAGGDGSGTSRTFRMAGDAVSISAYGRIEDFLDDRGTTNVDELKQAITDDLAARKTQDQISVTATDTEGVAFGRDYMLGDKVAAVAADVRITDLIREIDVELSPDAGEVVTVTVGSPAAATPDEIEKILKAPIRKVGRRLRRLEART